MDKDTIRTILCYIRKHTFLVILSLVLAAVTVVSTLYLPILTGHAIDCMIAKGKVDFAALRPILEKMIVTLAITGFSQWLMNVCNNRITYLVMREIREDAFHHIHDLPLKYLDGHPSGDIVSRVIADVDQFADGLLMGFSQLFTGVITILGTLIFMLTVNVGITFVVVLLTPLSLFVANFIARRTFSMFKKQSEARAEQTALVDEMVGNEKVVQAFTHEAAAQETFDEINERLRASSLKAIFYSSITNPSTRFINSVVYAGVGLTGALAAVSGAMTVGGLSAFLSYANQYTKPFNEISGVITELQNALVCAARLFELIEEPSQIPDAENARVLTAPEGRIIAENVAFGKPDATREEIIRACDEAYCDHFIRTLPQGYDTVIGSDTSSISSGQKQLLTIARALLAQRELLILDEATSNVDTRTELLIQKAMDRLMRGRTCFIIAHRLSTIVDADLILVLRDGRIVEQGTHPALLAKKGFYYEIYKTQYDTA